MPAVHEVQGGNVKRSSRTGKGKAPKLWALAGGLGMAAALTLVPVLGVAGASQTLTTTVGTSGTWTSGTGVLAECPVSTNTPPYNYTTLTGATWTWANLGQASCTTTSGVKGPGTVPAGTVTLSTTFTVHGHPSGATLTLAADNGATVWLNGTQVATLATNTSATNFDQVHSYAVTASLVRKSNTIAIAGTNAPGGGYDPAGVLAKLTVTSTVTTHLQFVTQPARTQTGTPILSTVDSTGTPIKVEVLFTTGTLDTAFNGAVAIGKIGNPSTSALSGGTPPVTAHTGLATFSTLRIDHAGSYRLRATSGAATTPTPATSTRFNVDTKLVKCASAPCGAAGHVTATVMVTENTTTPNAGYIALGFGGAPTFTCGTPSQLPAKDAATVDVLKGTGRPTPQSNNTWTVAYTISKTILTNAGPEGASKWQVCWASTTPFTGLTGPAAYEPLTTGGGTVHYYVGLLASCSKSVPAPCILSRHKTNAGQEVITIQAAGDSYVRP